MEEMAPPLARGGQSLRRHHLLRTVDVLQGRPAPVLRDLGPFNEAEVFLSRPSVSSSSDPRRRVQEAGRRPLLGTGSKFYSISLFYSPESS